MAKEFDEVEYTKADLATWKQVLSYMKGERRDVILLFVSVITLAILDTIYPKLNGIVIDQYVLTGNLEQLPLFAGIYLAFIALFGFIVWAFILLSDRLQLSISYQIRKDGFKKLQELSFSFMIRHPLDGYYRV